MLFSHIIVFLFLRHANQRPEQVPIKKQVLRKKLSRIILVRSITKDACHCTRAAASSEVAIPLSLAPLAHPPHCPYPTQSAWSKRLADALSGGREGGERSGGEVAVFDWIALVLAWKEVKNRLE